MQEYIRLSLRRYYHHTEDTLETWTWMLPQLGGYSPDETHGHGYGGSLFTCLLPQLINPVIQVNNMKHL